MRYLSYSGLLRRIRRLADLSQRELARAAGVSYSAVSEIEAGRGREPSARTLEKLLRAAGFELRAVDSQGRTVDLEDTWVDQDQPRDGAARRFPAHLDTREHQAARPWWHWLRCTGPCKPPLLTFGLNRVQRERWRREDGRTAADPDERMRFPGGRSAVHIPGYRPVSLYGGGADTGGGGWL